MRARAIEILQTGAAAALFVMAISCSPAPDTEASREHLEAGNRLLQAGRLEAAADEFEEALRFDVNAVEAEVGLANISVMRGRVGEAEERYESLLERHPDNCLVLAGWGKLLAATGRYKQAEPVLRVALATDHPPLDAAVDLARVLSALGREDEALGTWTRAADLGASRSVAFLIDWADALRRAGHDDDAITRLERAASMAPDNARVLEALGLAYLDGNRPGEAITILRRAVAATDPASQRYGPRSEALARALAAVPRGTASPTMPNVVLIIIDTLRADHIGAYGYEYPTTPNIDRLAERSVIFETAVSQAPWTAPAIASLFTGLYPSVHGLDGGIRWSQAESADGRVLPFAVQKTLPHRHETLAELFRAAGYSTAGFVSNLYVNAIFGFAQGFDHFDDSHDDYLTERGETKRRAQVTNDHVFEWLRSGVKEPFFLVVHYNDPHWPYEPPPPYGESFTAGYDGTLTPTTTREIVVTHHEVPPPISDRDLAYIVGLYDGEIQYVDAHLGRLLDVLDTTPTDRDLVTVLTADHGEEFLDHGAFNHGYTLYDEQTSVPLIISEPSRFEPRRVGHQVRLIDVAPTLLELAGVVNPDSVFQGRSLVAMMTGARVEDLDAFSEATNIGSQSAIRSTEGFKLIHSEADPRWLLFDLATDPDELRDLSRQQSSRLKDLASQIEAWRVANHALRREIGDSANGPEEVVLDETTQRGLEALGYIDR